MATNAQQGRERATGPGDLLSRLWPVLDPALDALPAGELIEAVLAELRRAFRAPVAALVLDGEERLGTPAEDERWDAGPRIDLPLHEGDEDVGRLELAVPDGALDAHERLALQLGAARLARAVARLRTEQAVAATQLRLRSDNYAAQRLLRVAGALMARHDLDHIVQYVTEEATALVRAQFGAFFLGGFHPPTADAYPPGTDAAGGRYPLYTIAGAPREAFSRFPMPRNTHVFGPTFRGEAVVRSDDITKDPRYGRNPPYHGMPEGHLPVCSYLAVPVKARDGEVLGGLFFGHSSSAVFDADAEALIVGVAALTALAIENARLHDDAERQLEATRRAYVERDQAALMLQESLLPRVLPEIAGVDVAARYAPGGRGIVGGDFYDLFPTGDGEWCAAIGDVEGKDARAAARTSLVRHAVRLAVIHSAGPTEAIRVVNGAVLQDQDDDDRRFSTLLLAVLRPAGGGLDVRLAGGGHPPGLVLRADGAVEEARCPGTLLGVVEDPRVSERDVRLESGDALVLYTDGLTEARRPGAVMGEARVRELLAGLAGADADAIADGLEAASLEFSGGRRADDLALLVLRVA